MQTFLPFSSFDDSARALDRQRLGKQRAEAWQIYLSLTTPSYGWGSHPAVRMWDGYEPALLVYGANICMEWVSRGYKDSMLERFTNEFTVLRGFDDFEYPPWFGMREFHESHRAMLWRKDPEYYVSFWGTFDPEITDYLWPKGEEFNARINETSKRGSSTPKKR